MYKQKSLHNKYLVFGILLIIFGGILLLYTNRLLQTVFSLWPIILILLGLLLLYLVYSKKEHDGLIFPGTFSLLTGIFLLSLNTMFTKYISLKCFWPIFMTIAGLSFLIYGISKSGYTRMQIIIASISVMVISLFLFLFSLDIITMSFKAFVIRWWPALLVLVGILLLIVHWINKK